MLRSRWSNAQAPSYQTVFQCPWPRAALLNGYPVSLLDTGLCPASVLYRRRRYNRLGIRGVRGQVFTGNGSLVRNFTPRLRLGAELFGAVTNNFNLSRGQLVAQIGGGYALRENLEFTFGVLSGRFPASPRAAVQIGLAYDFR